MRAREQGPPEPLRAPVPPDLQRFHHDCCLLPRPPALPAAPVPVHAAAAAARADTHCFYFAPFYGRTTARAHLFSQTPPLPRCAHPTHCPPHAHTHPALRRCLPTPPARYPRAASTPHLPLRTLCRAFTPLELRATRRARRAAHHAVHAHALRFSFSLPRTPRTRCAVSLRAPHAADICARTARRFDVAAAFAYRRASWLGRLGPPTVAGISNAPSTRTRCLSVWHCAFLRTRQPAILPTYGSKKDTYSAVRTRFAFAAFYTHTLHTNPTTLISPPT